MWGEREEVLQILMLPCNVGALKSKVLSHLSPMESKGLLINTQSISQKLSQVGEVVIQLLTGIEGLEVESMHKEEGIKVFRKKIQLLEGMEAHKRGGKNGGGKEGGEGGGEGGGREERGNKHRKAVSHSSQEGLDAEEATISGDQCALAE